MAANRQERRATSGSPAPRPPAARAKRNGTPTAAVIGAVVLLAALAALLLWRPWSREPAPGVDVATLGAVHAPPYVYNTRPPTSGNHLDQPSAYGHISGGLVAEAAVHNMEHGAVVIWYQPGDARLAGDVNRLVAALGRECLVAGPYAQMDTAVAATAWGRLLTLSAFDEAQLTAFVKAFRGKRGPEAGVCTRES